MPVVNTAVRSPPELAPKKKTSSKLTQINSFNTNESFNSFFYFIIVVVVLLSMMMMM